LDQLKAQFADPENDLLDMDKFMSLRQIMQAHTYLLVAKRKEELTLERLEAFKKRNTNAYKDCISKASQEMNQTNQAETIFALEHMDIKIDQYLAAMAKHAPEKKF